MNFKETKTRTIFKSISWRVLAFINSWLILLISSTESSFLNALLMNITGFILFYFFERVWNKIRYGRKIEEVNK